MRTHTCLECGAVLKHYDFVSRSVRTQNRNSNIVKIERFKCPAESDAEKRKRGLLLWLF